MPVDFARFSSPNTSPREAMFGTYCSNYVRGIQDSVETGRPSRKLTRGEAALTTSQDRSGRVKDLRDIEPME